MEELKNKKARLERTRNSLFTNHEKMHEHKNSKQPGKDEGMQAVKASQGRLAHTLTTSKELDHEVTNHWNSRRNSRNDFDSPVTHLIPWEGISGHTKGDRDHRHDDSRHPGQLSRTLEATREIDAENVKNEHQHHHAGAPTMHRANQPAKADIRHEVLDRGVGLSDGRLVIKRHREAARELDQEAGEGDSAQAIEDVDVRWDVFRRDVVRDRLDLEALIKPLINRVGLGVGRGRRRVRHAAGCI